MRILLDENLDWRLGRHLPGHAVTSVAKAGWAGIKNGELLRRADSAFEVLVTMDKGIYHQQNLSGLKVTVIALRAKTNRLAETALLMPALLALLPRIKPGEFHSVS
jgi:predicted nuclease of predicted toxin-antitoxin system